MYIWIKLTIAWPISWALYYLGNLFEDLTILFDNYGWRVFGNGFYKPIQKYSFDVQSWAGGRYDYFPHARFASAKELFDSLDKEAQEDDKHQPVDLK